MRPIWRSRLHRDGKDLFLSTVLPMPETLSRREISCRLVRQVRNHMGDTDVPSIVLLRCRKVGDDVVSVPGRPGLVIGGALSVRWRRRHDSGAYGVPSTLLKCR